ncbi:MAG: YdcF family protein [Candidatus Rokubacteria bacterium]|nr:YdcF family protein [Candidatus Rokubacteria bacterium]
MITGNDIVCISSIDWDFLWQGHQHVMATLARHGNRVLYIENTGVRRPTLRDVRRVRDRLRNWWRGTNGFREALPNLVVYSPIVLPFLYSRLARRVNRALLLRALDRWMRATGFRRPIAWTFLPTPLARDLVRGLDPALVVYHCVDDFASSSAAARRIRSSEEALFREADLVFVTSDKLRARAERAAAEVHVFPFAVDYERFARVRDGATVVPPGLRTRGAPVAGYIGGVHGHVDQELLVTVARTLPHVDFVLVGPIQVDVERLRRLPNVRLLGAREHHELPRYVKGFDVGLVPYRLNEYTWHVYPTKLNEYLAMGIPVVATDLAEVRRFNVDHGQIVGVATTPAEFAAAVDTAIARPSKAGARERIAVARLNSWDERIERMSKLVERAVADRRAVQPTWDVALRRVYRRARGRALATVVGLVGLYVAAFHSPLVWAVAAPLKVVDTPRAADAIVVFAGGVGESGKAGGGYQERVKHAVDLYQAGHARRIVFSSGYVFAFREAEVMRDLAIGRGVPRDAIVLEQWASNTRENVAFVSAVARREAWRSVLLVSSPYHMRRALLTWRREAPDVVAVAAPVPKSQFYVHDGPGATPQQIWAVVHEYAAIAAYWWNGWI